MNRRKFTKRLSLSSTLYAANNLFSIPAGKKRPNILFFFPDQHRYDWISMNPKLPDITPSLKKLAQNGVHFGTAFCPAPVCAPSRGCLASGIELAHCKVKSNRDVFPIDETSFYKLLRDSGYYTLACGKFDLAKPNHSWGRDGQHKRPGKTSLIKVWGFTKGIDNEGKKDGIKTYQNEKEKMGPYFAFLEKHNLVEAYFKHMKTKTHDYEGESILPEFAYGDNWIAQNGLDLIKTVPKGTPWFIQVNFNGPHSPMDITKSMYEKWKKTPFPPMEGMSDSDKGKKGVINRRNYAAMINNIDTWLKKYIDEIKKRGELNNTIIIYCSDHGEMLGQRGLGGKTFPFHASACVPLVVSGPGIKTNITCNDPVETLDLTATFLDYAGIKIPEKMDSISLRPFLEGKGKLPRQYATSSLQGWSLVFDGRYKLIGGTRKQWHTNDDTGKKFWLFDLKNDPNEMNEISSKHPDIVARLEQRLPPYSTAKPKTKPKKDKSSKKAKK